MHHVHPIIALDLARSRSREHDLAAQRARLAREATSGRSPVPKGAAARRRAGAGRRATVAALRAIATASTTVAGSAGRAASRLEGDPA